MRSGQAWPNPQRRGPGFCPGTNQTHPPRSDLLLLLSSAVLCVVSVPSTSCPLEALFDTPRHPAEMTNEPGKDTLPKQATQTGKIREFAWSHSDPHVANR
jgi:hypothetical protein